MLMMWTLPGWMDCTGMDRRSCESQTLLLFYSIPLLCAIPLNIKLNQSHAEFFLLAPSLMEKQLIQGTWSLRIIVKPTQNNRDFSVKFLLITRTWQYCTPMKTGHLTFVKVRNSIMFGQLSFVAVLTTLQGMIRSYLLELNCDECSAMEGKMTASSHSIWNSWKPFQNLEKFSGVFFIHFWLTSLILNLILKN